jgi:small subunit ribosomal protein S6
MRLYEVVYIFDTAMDEAAVSQKLEEYHALVTTDIGGEITAVDHWGARQLAYPIKKEKSGYFVVAQFKTEPVSLPEFERLLKLDDQVLRYLVVLNEGEPTTGMSSLAPRPPVTVEREDDEDDKDKGGEEDEEAEAESEPRTSPPEFAGGRGRRRRVEGPPVQLLNYKDVSTLSRFLTEQGKILPKRTTKVTARFQRQLGTAVKRARYLSLLPYIRDHEA